jgi:hypothetical protein
LVGPEALALLEMAPDHHGALSADNLQSKHFQFIVIQVDGTEPETLSVAIDHICDVFTENNVTPDFGGGFAIGYLGARDPELDSPELRFKIVNSLLARLGDQIRIVHGECTGHFGVYGSSLQFTYGAISPRFSEIVDELTRMHDGTATEFQ